MITVGSPMRCVCHEMTWSRLEPSPENGLNKVSYVMTDKIVTVDRKLLGYQVGVVDDAAMANIGRQLMRVLGLL